MHESADPTGSYFQGLVSGYRLTSFLRPVNMLGTLACRTFPVMEILDTFASAMKIYTKTGDSGMTSLIGGTRVPKSHLRIECYGTVDELNGFIGLISDQDISAGDRLVLTAIQNCLFVIGASLAADPERSRMQIPDLKEDDIAVLETEMDTMTGFLPELKHFILPGGLEAASFCHVARSVCRRAERLAVALSAESHVDEQVVIYLNRLSDYLFTLARKFVHEKGAEERKWTPRA
jgi:cob(I)alamin adenosyltransferase